MLLDRLLAAGPILVLIAWFAAGQWDLAGPEIHAWLQFVSVIWIASLVPLPGARGSVAGITSRVRWWGWAIVATLVMAS